MSRMPQVSFEVFPPSPKTEDRFWTTVARLAVTDCVRAFKQTLDLDGTLTGEPR